MRGGVGFEWDERQARANLRKHKVDFADAATVFEDDQAVTVSGEHAEEVRTYQVGANSAQLPGKALRRLDFMRPQLASQPSGRFATSSIPPTI